MHSNSLAAQLFLSTPLPGKLKGCRVTELIPSLSPNEWESLKSNCEKRAVATHLEFRKPGAEPLWLELLIQKTPRKKDVYLVLFHDCTEHHKLKVTLSESLTLYKSLVEQIPAGVFRKDFDGCYVYVNEWFCNLRGLKPSEIIGKRPSDFLTAVEAMDPRIEHLLLQGEEDHKYIVKTGQWIVREEEYPEREGKPHWVLSVKTPVYAPDGKIIGSQGLLFDITNTKRVEAAIRKQQAFLSIVLDNLPAIVFAKDLNGRYILTNRTHQAVLGATKEEILGKTGFDFHPPNLARAYQQEEELVIKTGQASLPKEELAFNHTLGEYRWHLTSRIPLKDESGQVCGVLGISLDVTDRKKTIEALEKSEAKYRTLIDQVADIVLLHDLMGRIVDVNRRAIELLGYDRNELLNMSIGELCPECLSHDKVELWHKIVAGETLSLERSFKTKSGNFIPVELRLAAVALQENQLILSVGRDITQRKKEEQARIKSQEKRQLMLETLRELAMSQNLADGHILEFSKQLTESVGKRLNIERVGVWLFEENATKLINIDTFILSSGVHTAGEVLIESEFRPEFETLKTSLYVDAEDALNDPRVAGYVQGYLTKHGITSMLDVGIVLKGQPVGVLCFEHVGPQRKWESEEIHFACQLADQLALALMHYHRREAERALRESEARFRMLVEYSNDIIAIINSQGFVRYYCPSTARILGYNATEILGKNVLDIVHPEDRDKTMEGIALLQKDPEKTVRIETRVKHKDGSWRIMETVARQIPGKTSEPLIVFNARDVTEQRQLEEHLRQASKLEAIGHIAGGIAHDFNNVLATIMMQAELGSQIQGLPPEAIESFAHIRAATAKAAELTQKLLIISRREVFQPTVLNLNECLQNVVSLITRTIGDDIQLKICQSEEPLLIRGDPALLETVILNLVVNARDAMPNGGELTISTELQHIQTPEQVLNPHAKPGAFAVLTIADTGCGIPPDILPRIFEPFFTTKPKGKGTGLGLSTAYGIVQQHHGWISVTTAVGKGSTFQVFLPLIEKEVPRTTPSAKYVSPPRGSETILLVEDEAPVRKLTRIILERAGYRVLEAETASEAIDIWMAHKQEIQLLFTDLSLPGGINGHHLAERLRREAPNLPVVYTTGYSAELAGQELSLGKIEAFVQKPASPTKILEVVRQCLDMARNSSS